MPLYMDVHERLPDATAVADVHRDVRARRGARCLGYWHAGDAGKLFCLIEAPSAEAAASVHREARGFRADRIYEVTEGEPMLAGQEGTVSGPFIFMTTHEIQKGKADAYVASLKELIDLVEDREPRLIAFNIFVNDEGTEVTGVQVHPDAESMQLHMQVIADHLESAYDYLEAGRDSFQVYGTPFEGFVEQLSQFAGPGGVTVKPKWVGGFVRT